MNVKLGTQMIKNMGIRYVKYRIRHEIERKTGVLKKRFPANSDIKKFVTLEKWRSEKDFFLNFNPSIKKPSVGLQQKTENILSGNILYFNKNWINVGRDYDWITNPSNGYKYDISKHWSEIADLSEVAGDIKYVWEKSRFSYLLTLIRYDFHTSNDLSEFVFSEIDSWIKANPINKGPNWRCSQEISLRIFNWCFALSYYRDSEALTEERWNRIQNVIYWSLHHVYHHIDFSRIAVRNNHAITETLFLALSNMMFPFIPETKKWSEKGRKWFEEEIDYQIYEDGTFLQFSMNYHRVVIQLFSLAFSVSEFFEKPFSKNVYQKAYKSLNFLYQCTQDENGWLPNYGSNDGALFFPFSDSDYRDYRPHLNTLHKILIQKDIYNETFIQEDSIWFGEQKKSENNFQKLVKDFTPQSFVNGGFYLLRQGDFFTFIRCGNHKDRPAQADNLHLDLWYKGENILRDSGTYKYNTNPEILEYFMGTKSHNSVMIENHSQMLRGGRFIWYYWTQAGKVVWKQTENSYIFEGEISAFRFLKETVIHKRRIEISKIENKWFVSDQLNDMDHLEKRQIWHPNSAKISFESEGEEITFDSFNSDYYGEMKEMKSIYFPFFKKIKTIITYK